MKCKAVSAVLERYLASSDEELFVVWSEIQLRLARVVACQNLYADWWEEISPRLENMGDLAVQEFFETEGQIAKQSLLEQLSLPPEMYADGLWSGGRISPIFAERIGGLFKDWVLGGATRKQMDELMFAMDVEEDFDYWYLTYGVPAGEIHHPTLPSSTGDGPQDDDFLTEFFFSFGGRRQGKD